MEEGKRAMNAGLSLNLGHLPLQYYDIFAIADINTCDNGMGTPVFLAAFPQKFQLFLSKGCQRERVRRAPLIF